MFRFVLLLLAFASGTAHAEVISYELANLHGSRWQYTYMIRSNDFSESFDEISIYFGVNQYTNISLETVPTEWDALLFQPDLALPADGYLDVVIASDAIADRSNMPFAVSFDYLGFGDPGTQSYELYNSSDFTLLRNGLTYLDASPFQIPEPGSFFSLVAAGLMIALHRKRHVGNAVI